MVCDVRRLRHGLYDFKRLHPLQILIRTMTREQQVNTITTDLIRERLALMSADVLESFIERVAIMHIDGRLPVYQAEHEAFTALKRSWQK